MHPLGCGLNQGEGEVSEDNVQKKLLKKPRFEW